MSKERIEHKFGLPGDVGQKLCSKINYMWRLAPGYPTHGPSTMVFGLTAATILVLVLVPTVVGLGGDIKRVWDGYWVWGTKEKATPLNQPGKLTSVK